MRYVSFSAFLALILLAAESVTGTQTVRINVLGFARPLLTMPRPKFRIVRKLYALNSRSPPRQHDVWRFLYE